MQSKLNKHKWQSKKKAKTITGIWNYRRIRSRKIGVSSGVQ